MSGSALAQAAVPRPGGVLSPGWTAAPERTISLALPALSSLRGVRTAAGPTSLLTKSAADALDFAVDCSTLLRAGTDAIASAQITVPIVDPATDLQVLWFTILSGQLVMLLAGGLPGAMISMVLQVTTSAGRVRNEKVWIQIDANTPATLQPAPPSIVAPNGIGTIPIPPNAIALPGGILVNAAGLPFLLA